jgi:hypothetical protein
VIIVQVRSHSPDPESFQFSQRPAKVNWRPSFMAIANGSLHFVLLAGVSTGEGAIVIVIIHFEFQDCANSGKTVEHRGNERPVSQS